MDLGLVNKLSSIFGWLRLRLAVSAKLGLPTSRPAFCFLASLVLAQPKTKPNFFTSPKDSVKDEDSDRTPTDRIKKLAVLPAPKTTVVPNKV